MAKHLFPLVCMGMITLTGCSSHISLQEYAAGLSASRPDLAPGEIRKELMTDADREYLQELLTPLIESEAYIAAYKLEPPPTDEAGKPIGGEGYLHMQFIGPLAQAHFQVLAACPYKIYTGAMPNNKTTYAFSTIEGAIIRAEIDSNPLHGVNIGGINISAPDFHHYLHTLVRRKEAASTTQEPQH